MRWPFQRSKPNLARPDPVDLLRQRYLGEESLFFRLGGSALRLVFEPSFRGVPMIVEVDWPHERALISASLPYQDQEPSRGVLSPEDAFDLELAFREAGFWEAPETDGRCGLDGDQWVLERREGERHHVVFRWTPRRSDPLFDLLREVLRLAGQDLDQIDAQREEARRDGLSLQRSRVAAERRAWAEQHGLKERCPWGGCDQPATGGDDVCRSHRIRLDALSLRRSS